ncbi:MAG: hypothetical protein LRY43_03375 [Gammaproteobacteria bacterium]|nr:hypothetical protein [Gammaproteobacteria bacterium]
MQTSNKNKVTLANITSDDIVNLKDKDLSSQDISLTFSDGAVYTLQAVLGTGGNGKGFFPLKNKKNKTKTLL